MSSATTSPAVGQLLDHRYRVEELIARGGMASVHRGVDERLGRPVALKIMHPHLADDESFRTRFFREAHSAARLAHPHVVPVYDQGEDGGQVYLAMQLIEGGTLRDLLRERAPLTIRTSLELAAQILEALGAAHRAGIIHRDVKPENVLLEHTGAGPLDRTPGAKVADFGLARAIGAATASSTGTLLGTVAYVSPETITRGSTDERSDLYSLGVVLFEMLTGTQPFVGEQPVHVAFQHVHEDIPAPSSRISTIPAGVDALVTWAAARRPDSRPVSAEALLSAVREQLADLPARVLDAIPAPRTDADTQDVPRVTALLDVDPARASDDPPATPTEAAAPRPPRRFLTPTPRTVADEDREDPGTSARTVAMAVPRAPRARHGKRRRSSSPWMRGAAVAAVLALTGTGAAQGADWYLGVGPGADRTVPVLAGTTLDDAEAALSSQDLTARTEERFSSTVPAGHVVSVSPAPGSTVKKDTPVLLVVSRGVETFPVPDVTGASLEDARARVAEAGLTLVEDDPEFSETVPEGEVIRQEAAAERLPSGGEVHVVLSRGRVALDVPDTRGRTRGQAIALIEKQGLRAEVVEAHSASTPKGAVASQKPTSGTLHRGDTVRIVVSLGPEMVTVPNVFQKPEAEAVAALKNAGLTPKVVHDKGTPAFGLVYQQDTAGGTSVPKGSTVLLHVF
ncbi:Stk1 family PASTA domain-containing Ser/Thr kinase [Brachybacterium sp. EF45031]|uniref:Stk1 family PASTA domain-containing Ser/Thr kinase n=1 Tax=Brachybacterium sillae TaxID=2810536 RepID=UPI00217F22D1|nr:Stk1 family PASTA domain-containing Ser/Thr kinase [Brachybacterium sillae]MCS6710494.1 Stk1 family PASTA domain-containing Ser/Thr kinase [Brachybacterium sillae]